MSYTVGKLLNSAFCPTYRHLCTSDVFSPGVPDFRGERGVDVDSVDFCRALGVKIRWIVNEKGGDISSSRLAWAPLLDLAVTGLVFVPLCLYGARIKIVLFGGSLTSFQF